MIMSQGLSKVSIGDSLLLAVSFGAKRHGKTMYSHVTRYANVPLSSDLRPIKTKLAAMTLC
jgi:hypothetical protein